MLNDLITKSVTFREKILLYETPGKINPRAFQLIYGPSGNGPISPNSEFIQATDYNLNGEEALALDKFKKSHDPQEIQIAKLFERGLLPRSGGKIGKILHALKDDKYQNNKGLEYLKTAISKQLFTTNSTLPWVFFETFITADPDSDEYNYAQEVLWNRTTKFSKWEEKAHKDRVGAFRATRETKDMMAKTKSATGMITDQASFTSRINTLSGEESAPNWVPTNLAPEVRQELHNNAHSLKIAYSKAIECMNLLENPEIKASQREKILLELKEHDAEIAELESAHESKEKVPLFKNFAQYKAINRFSSETGLDLATLKKITIWDVAAGLPQNASPVTINLYSDPKTGRVAKKFDTIELQKIEFEDDNEKIDDPTSPGLMFITYKDIGGQIVKNSPKNFQRYLWALEAFEPIEKPQEANTKISRELGFKEIQKCGGDLFQGQNIVGVDPATGEYIYEPVQFRIQQVTLKDGQWVVVLDRDVITINREKLDSPSLPRDLNFDRVQREFTLGEFVKYLRINDIARYIPPEEIAEFNRQNFRHTQKTCLDMFQDTTEDEREKLNIMLGLNDENIIEPPRPGESKIYTWDNALVQISSRLEGKEVIYYRSLLPPPRQNSDVPNIAEKRWRDRSPERIGNIHDFVKCSHKMGHFMTGGNPAGTLPPDQTLEGTIPPSNGKQKIREPQPDIKDDGASPDWLQKVTDERKISTEFLPKDQVFKFGDMTAPEQSYFTQLWRDTRILSVNDIWQLMKAGYEYYIRRFERTQKGRYSDVTKQVPFWGQEMKRINQNAENEEVNQFKEAMEQMGVSEIQAIMRSTHNRDQMKACFIVLTAKGQLRFDDIEMWSNMNRFLAADKLIPIPGNGDPRTQISEKDERTGLDFLHLAIDATWGEGQFSEWYSGNKSTFAGNAKKFYEKGKELEGVQGGHGRRLAFLLAQHKKGEWADAQEFEGLILHSIEAGKISMQEKLYYMVEGVACENQYGRTLLDYDRMAHINSEMLIRFPLLEYLCQSQRREGGPYRVTKDDFKRWVEDWDHGQPLDPANNKPNERVYEFLWKHVIPNDHTQNRINKAIRNGENIDHDDMFAYLPPATEQIITDACKGLSGGGKKFFTVEGYANAFPGFSQYIRSLAENQNMRKMIEAIKSYVRFESIMTGRWDKYDKHTYQRMDKATLQSGTIVTDTPPVKFIDELNTLVRNIATLYSSENPQLMNIVSVMQTYTGSERDPGQKDLQGKIEDALQGFGEEFDKAVNKDPTHGLKLLQLVQSSNLEGLPAYISPDELAMRKALKKSAAGSSE